MTLQSTTMSDTNPDSSKPKSESFLESVASTILIFVLWIFVITFAFQNFVIPSASMASTLLVGDHVLVDRLTFAPPSAWTPFVQYRDPKPSDVVVFFKPTTEPNGDHLILVKRIIGVPGDRIHLLDGTVFRNGVPQVELHAIQPASGSYDTYRDDFPSVLPNQTGITATWSVDLPSHIIGGDLVIPPGNYFVMGDNRATALTAATGASFLAPTSSAARSLSIGPSPRPTTRSTRPASPTALASPSTRPSTSSTRPAGDAPFTSPPSPHTASSRLTNHHAELRHQAPA